MRDVIKRNKENPGHIGLAAKKDGKLVGSLLAVTCEMFFGLCKSFMVIEDIIVDKSFRGSGIGRALMANISV